MTSALRRGSVAGAVLAMLCATNARATSYPGFQTMVTDSTRIFAVPATAKPLALAPALEPTFGTRVVRIAGNTGTALGGGVSGTWASQVKHHYSKDQPWSSDGA